ALLFVGLDGDDGVAGEDEQFKIFQDFHASVSPSDTPPPQKISTGGGWWRTVGPSAAPYAPA
ncbi:MAG: hypothetical protein ACREJ1_04800, partial [Candidatus Methylomirabilales bacterium]